MLLLENSKIIFKILFMLDRTIPPRFQTIDHINFPWPALHMLSNQMPLYWLNMGSQPIIEVELIFKTGRFCEKKNGGCLFYYCYVARRNGW